MATMLRNIYAALIEAGASEEKAGAAAEEIANYDNQLADIRSTLRLHSWILSVNTALLLALLVKSFF